jgi:WD40 repeat protein
VATISPATGNALPVDYELGEYSIQTVLGVGGFGMTYLAHDTRLKSQVAIKEYFPQAYSKRTVTGQIEPHASIKGAEENYQWGLNEFLKEAQVLARFKHAHIVRVLRFLETNGTAYMVMEYEAGESLLAYLNRHGGYLPEQMLLNIFIPVLNGLQAVHDAGLLHLDIKPDNIYLRASGQPLLIDFGSSRQAREDGAANQKVALSRGYAAPEQYPGHGQRGPWSDVYGMGATLYRCVTAREPTDAIERQRIFAKNRVDPIVPAANMDRPKYAANIRASVDAALRLNAEERPRSARALQNGLMGKEMTDEQAKPWVGYGRGTGFIGIARAAVDKVRRKGGRSSLDYFVASLVFVAAMLITVPKVLVSTGYMTDEDVFTHIDTAHAAVRSIPRRMKQFVDEDILGTKPAPPAPTEEARPRLRAPRPVIVRPVEPFDVLKRTTQSFSLHAPATSVAILLDGSMIATALNDGTIQLWEGGTGKWIRTLVQKSGRFALVAASPDGRWLAYTDADHAVRLWDAIQDETVGPLYSHGDVVNALAFSADSKWFASGGDDTKVNVWNIDTRAVAKVLAARSVVLALAFAPNARMLAGVDAAGAIQYWDIPGGAELSYTPAQEEALTALAYSPDGQWLAVAGQQGFARVVKIGVARDDHQLAQVPATVSSIAYSPDGKWLLLAGASDDAIEIRDAQTGEVANRLAGHARAVVVFSVSADGKLMASADEDNKVRLWR